MADVPVVLTAVVLTAVVLTAVVLTAVVLTVVVLTVTLRHYSLCVKRYMPRHSSHVCSRRSYIFQTERIGWITRSPTYIMPILSLFFLIRYMLGTRSHSMRILYAMLHDAFSFLYNPAMLV